MVTTFYEISYFMDTLLITKDKKKEMKSSVKNQRNFLISKALLEDSLFRQLPLGL